MAKRTNPASRLRDLVSPLVDTKGETQVLQIWAEAFGVFGSPNSPEYDTEVMGSLQLVRHEIDAIRTHMTSRTDFSPHLYDKSLKVLTKITMAQNLSQKWNNLQRLLSADIILALDWCSEIMPDESQEVSEQLIADIQQKVDDLESALQNDEIPLSLQALGNRHLTLLKRALRNTKVAGKKAFRQAMYEAHADIIDNAEVIVANEARPIMRILREVWAKVKVTSGIVWELDKIGGAGRKALEWFNNFKDAL